MDRKEARRMPRSAQISLASAVQAVNDAGLPELMPEPERAGVVFGTAMGGTDALINGLESFTRKDTKELSLSYYPAVSQIFQVLQSQKDFNV